MLVLARFFIFCTYFVSHIYMAAPHVAGRHQTTCVVPRSNPSPRHNPSSFGGLEVGTRSGGAVSPAMHVSLNEAYVHI